jgi:hypothetical protein
MTIRKRLTTLAVASVCLGVCASASLAAPLILGPAPVPAIKVAPVVHVAPLKTQLLNSYRQVRAFWLGRAIVR